MTALLQCGETENRYRDKERKSEVVGVMQSNGAKQFDYRRREREKSILIKFVLGLNFSFTHRVHVSGAYVKCERFTHTESKLVIGSKRTNELE